MDQPTQDHSSQAGQTPASAADGATRSAADLAAQLQMTQQQLDASQQANQQLLRQNQQLRGEIEQLMASALNLHQIISTSLPTAPAQPSDAPPAPETSSTTSTDGQSYAVISDANIDKGDADDMFAELDRLLADDSGPAIDESLRSGLNYVPPRRTSSPTTPKPSSPKPPSAKPPSSKAPVAKAPESKAPAAKASTIKTPLSQKPADNLRRTVAATPQPVTTAAPPRRLNPWLVLATILVMISCFGASFFVVLSMLRSTNR
ncbi:MAG: hypothetical protein AAF289_09930 [Cyanobacteria bacterium P01_A01_bin.135]